jgi:hypothetical protein
VTEWGLFKAKKQVIKKAKSRQFDYSKTKYFQSQIVSKEKEEWVKYLQIDNV